MAIKHIRHPGTLGTGNHFIEVRLDEAGFAWFMLHSGSRGVGNFIGTTFIELAKQDAMRHQANLHYRDLACFEEGSRRFGDYVRAAGWAQKMTFGYSRRGFAPGIERERGRCTRGGLRLRCPLRPSMRCSSHESANAFGKPAMRRGTHLGRSALRAFHECLIRTCLQHSQLLLADRYSGS